MAIRRMSVALKIEIWWDAIDQTQSFPIRAMNVCFRQEPPYRIRDRTSAAHMTADGWSAAINPSD